MTIMLLEYTMWNPNKNTMYYLSYMVLFIYFTPFIVLVHPTYMVHPIYLFYECEVKKLDFESQPLQ
jgi:hypothetical protein